MQLPPIYIGADNDIEVTNLRVRRTQAPVTAATIEVLLRDPAGEIVDGSQFSLSLVAGTENDYLGVCPGTVELEEGKVYTLVAAIEADEGDLPIRRKFRAEYFTGDEACEPEEE